MRLERTVYSVLIVSSADNFKDAFSALLSPCEHSPVEYATSVSAAKRLVAQKQFDFVIINAPLPDESGAEFACELSQKSGSAILLFANVQSFSAFYEKLTPFGVFTLNKPISQHSAINALLWLAAARERLKQHEVKTISLEQKMKDIRTINKAKWLLIENENMSEGDAHRYIEKQAMDKCVAKITVAKEIISRLD